MHTNSHPSGRSAAISKGSVSNLLPGSTLKAEPGAQPPCSLLPVPCRAPGVPAFTPEPHPCPLEPLPCFPPLSLSSDSFSKLSSIGREHTVLILSVPD